MTFSVSGRRYLMSVLFLFLPTTRLFSFKKSVLKWAGVGVAEDTSFNSHIKILGAGKIEFGESTWVGFDGFYAVPEPAKISIGARCDIAPGVRFVCGTHELGTSDRRAGPGLAENILVGSGTWVGAGAILLGGANVGAGSVIAAGAVVRKGDYPPNCLLAGNPARVVKEYGNDVSA